MRIAQLTQLFSPLLAALVLLQHITIPALAVHQLNPSQLRQHQSRPSSMDQPDDIGDNGCSSDTNAGGASNCGMMNRNSAKQTATNIAQKAAQEAEQAYETQQCAAAKVALQVKEQEFYK